MDSLDNLRMVGINEICDIFDCEKQKGRQILKVAFQMKYATKVGRSMYMSQPDLVKFLDLIKGREVIV